MMILICSGSQTAFVPNTTVKVPQDLLQFVYGENGTNLNDIREVSWLYSSCYYFCLLKFSKLKVNVDFYFLDPLLATNKQITIAAN